jgi:hypothetical protein
MWPRGALRRMPSGRLLELSVPIHSKLDLIERLEKGLSVSVVKTPRARVGLTDEEVHRLIAPRRTLNRREAERQPLSTEEAHRGDASSCMIFHARGSGCEADSLERSSRARSARASHDVEIAPQSRRTRRVLRFSRKRRRPRLPDIALGAFPTAPEESHARDRLQPHAVRDGGARGHD